MVGTGVAVLQLALCYMFKYEQCIRYNRIGHPEILFRDFVR